MTVFNRSFFTLLIIICFVRQAGAQTQPSNTEPGINISGFINHEMIYDTRKTISAREGEVLLFPAPVNEDVSGIDQNSVSSFNMLTFHSRLITAVTGPDAGRFKTNGLIEFDFLGSSDASMNMIRLRHAYFKLEDDKFSLLFGQYWHPMFVTECFPAVISWNAGLPIHPLSRNPQVRISWKPTSTLKLSGTILTQRDFVSAGPDGNSSQYMRDSKMPSFQAQVMYSPSKNTLLGATFGYKTLVPRTSSEMGLSVNETITSYNSNIFAKYSGEYFSLKIQGIYGENMSDLLMIGGYGIHAIEDNIIGEQTYINMKTGSVWSDMNYKAGSVNLGLFSGFTKNLGSDSNTEYSPDSPEVYGLGTNVHSLLRVSPRITFGISTNIRFSFEWISDAVVYGDIYEDLSIINSHKATNQRFLISSSLTF